MTATYTTRIRLTKQGTGDNDSTWGVVLNDEVIDLTDYAIAGYTTISLAAGDVSLTINDGAADEARSAMLELTGTLTGDRGVYLPTNISKSYIVKNDTSGAYSATVLINGGTGSAIPQGSSVIVFTDGTTVTPATDTTGLGLGTAAELNFGTSINELIPVSSADTRYANVSSDETITGAYTFTSTTSFNTTEVIASATQAYSKPVSVAVASSAVSLDFSTGNNFTTILNGNVSIANPTTPQPGQSGIIYIRQDGTGSRTMSFNSSWDFAGGTAPTLSTAADAVDALIYNVQTSTAISAFVQQNLS
tara:strand:- start:1776 stop:2690 length:915 start_codon:yes stop_codon:yes gene_type:complete